MKLIKYQRLKKSIILTFLLNDEKFHTAYYTDEHNEKVDFSVKQDFCLKIERKEEKYKYHFQLYIDNELSFDQLLIIPPRKSDLYEIKETATVPEEVNEVSKENNEVPEQKAEEKEEISEPIIASDFEFTNKKIAELADTVLGGC